MAVSSPLTTAFLHWQGQAIHYRKFGRGNRLLIIIPGYGDRAKSYDLLIPVLSSVYTTFVLDLPFHGKTDWSKQIFSPSDFTEIIKKIATENNFDQYSLMGHSFGGQVILTILPYLIDQTEQLILLAPQGLGAPRKLSALAMPSIVNRLGIRIMEKYPGMIKKLSQLFCRLGLNPKSSNDFIQLNMATKKRQMRLINFWRSLDQFKVNRESVKQLINEQQLPVQLFFGQRDKVIPLEGGQWLDERSKSTNLHVLPLGHDMINFIFVKKLETIIS